MADGVRTGTSTEAPLFELLTRSGDGIVVVDREGRVLFANPAAAAIFGRTQEELTASALGLPLSSGEKTVVDVLHAGTQTRSVEMTATDTVWDDTPVRLAILRDVTEQVEVQEKYRLLAETSSDLIIVLENGTPTYVSPSAREILGYGPEELSSLGHLGTVHPDDRDRVTEEMRTRLFSSPAGRGRFVSRNLHADGSIRWLETTGATETLESGKTVTVLNTRDVTERVEANEELERAVEQKTFLMRELNHRVKNNLVLVTSLIATKEATLGGEADLSDLMSRVDAIRIVHEKLYQTNEVASISIRDYLEDLVRTVFASLSERHVRLELSIEDTSIPTKTAIPVGLIVNELATNAIKHGFSGGATGAEADADTAADTPGDTASAGDTAGDTAGPRFSVTFKRVSSAPGEELTSAPAYELTLSNNGPPIPSEVDLGSGKGLGLRLAALLAEQIGGTLEVRKEPSPTFTIRFAFE